MIRNLTLGFMLQSVQKILKCHLELKSKYIIFTLLIVFLTLVSLLPRCSPEPIQNIISWDFFAHIAKMRILESSFDVRLTELSLNMWRVNEATTYPPGYAVFFHFIKALTGVQYFNLPFMSIFLWIVFCLLLFVLPNKLDDGCQIGLISAVLGATFISGSNMLGPLYTAPANLDVILIMFCTFVLLSVKNKFHKVLLCSLLLGTVFVTHRPGIGAWIIFVLITAIFPLLFLKQKKEHLILYVIPTIVATILALDLSLLLWWVNFPLDLIIRLGGIIPQNITHNINPLIVLFAYISLHFSAIFAFWKYINIEGKLDAKYQKIQYKISVIEILTSAIIIPIVLGALIIYYVIQFKIPIGINLFAIFVQFWSHLSQYGSDTKFETIKQILYIWHYNIFVLLLAMPSFYIAIRKKYVPLLIAICISFLLSIFILFSIKLVFPWDLKIQRFYIYLAPFVFILCSWGFNSITCSFKPNIRQKMIALTKYLILTSLVLAVFSVNYTTNTMSLKSYDGYSFSQNLSGGLVATHPMAAQEARGLENFNFVSRYYLFTYGTEKISSTMQKTSYEYAFIQTDYPEAGQRMSNKFKNTIHFNKVFDNSNTEIYKLRNLADVIF